MRKRFRKMPDLEPLRACRSSAALLFVANCPAIGRMCSSRLLKNPGHARAGSFRWRQGDLRDKVHPEPLPVSRPREKPPGSHIVAPQWAGLLQPLMRLCSFVEQITLPRGIGREPSQ
jgi:hypothetical protein